MDDPQQTLPPAPHRPAITAIIHDVEEFRTIAESIPAAIGLVGLPERRFLVVNSIARTVFGYSEADTSTLTTADIYVDRIDQEHFIDILKERGSVAGYKLPIRRKDGSSFWTKVYVTPAVCAGKSCLLCSFIDSNDHKNIQAALAEDDALRRHAADLTAANRSLEAFAYSVSHDLRNPLHSILACCEVVKESLRPNDADGWKALEHISDATQRMGQIITDLMTLSRVTMQEVRISEFSLSDMALSIAGELEILDPARRVRYAIEPGMTARADENLVWMLLENLFHNAWKFSSKREAGVIEFGKLVDGGVRTYFVRDNGAGFDPSFADRLFKPFQRLHAQQEFAGTGIGLTIAKRIIEKHGGSIWAEAEKGKGATFFFTFGE